MFSSLKKLLSPSVYQAPAHRAYVSIVTQSRQPFFYEQCAVPDTVDGRFDVIVLHLFMVIQRLRREPSLEAGEFCRVLQEVFFSDMDRSVREMGVSDTGVGKRIKAMAQAFYGRLQAYEQTAANADGFKESLKRNLYREAPVNPVSLRILAEYGLRAKQALNEQDAKQLLTGEILFAVAKE